MLSDVAERWAHTEMAAEFRRALAEEEDHLARVRSWLNIAVEGEAGISEPPGRRFRPPFRRSSKRMPEGQASAS